MNRSEIANTVISTMLLLVILGIPSPAHAGFFSWLGNLFGASDNEATALSSVEIHYKDTGQFPGEHKGKGKSFKVADSSYHNIGVELSNKSEVVIESLPGMVTIKLDAIDPWFGSKPEAVTIDIDNLPPNKKYYLYQDYLENPRELLTSDAGKLSWEQETENYHYLILLEKPSTINIKDGDGGDCNQVGVWDGVNTCTLNQNVNETIEIKNKDIILDGGGYTVDPGGSGFGIFANAGLFQNVDRITIRNVNVINATKAIEVVDADGVLVDTVSAGNSSKGIEFNDITNSVIKNSTVFSNNASPSSVGIQLTDKSTNIVTGNTIVDNGIGLFIRQTEGNLIYKNNVMHNSDQVFFDDVSGSNSFTHNTAGGNYWSDFNCIQDAADEDKCTNDYETGRENDTAPWACQDGWKDSVDCPFATEPGGLVDDAIALAEEVVGAPYLWGGKGYDFTSGKRGYADTDTVKDTGYKYWNQVQKKHSIDNGLDCSGLSMWSYNRSYFGDTKVSLGRCINDQDCPVFYEGANGQYEGNVNEVPVTELEPGDLLFFDTNDDTFKDADHMAMYIGGTGDNVIHASGYSGTVTYASLDKSTNILTTKKGTAEQELEVDVYGRLKRPVVELQITAFSPVHLVVTDPDGYVSSLENQWESPMEYQVRDANGDGEDNENVLTWKRKEGDYLINVVAKDDASPTDTYTIIARALIGGVWVEIDLARDVPVSEIPDEPYVMQSGSGSISLVVKEDPEKVTICHVPPGNPSKEHTITVGVASLNAHLAHGDYEGTCDGRNDEAKVRGKDNAKGKSKGNGKK